MDRLEKTYKNKLTNYKSPVSDAVWDNVAASLIEDKKKYRFYFLLFFIGIILASIVGSILLSSNKKSNDSSKNIENKTNIAQNIAPVNNTETANSLIASNSINNELNINETSKSKILVGKNISKDNITNEKLEEKLISNHNPAHLNYSYNNNIINKNLNNSLLNSVSLDNKIGILNSNDNNSKQIRINNIFTRGKINVNFLESKKVEKINLLPSPSKIGLNHYNIVKSKIFQDGLLNDCFPTKINSWLLELYLSPDYADKNLQGNNIAYLNSRLNTEDPILSFSTGVRVGYLFNNGAVLKSGLNYSSINERFHIIIENVISTQTVITIDTIRHSDGSYSIQRDTTVNEKLGIEDIQKMTSYKMIGIPLIAGFEFRRWNHNFGINTGLIFNLITSQKGYMLNSDGDIEQFDNNDNKIFQNNLGISFYASLFYSYRLNNHFELFVEPKIRYYLKSFTLSNYPLEQKYTKYGISLGGRYIF